MNDLKYSSPYALRMAIDGWLKQRATSELERSILRKQIAFERLLARAIKVAPTGWILKGAFALDIRYTRTRTTKDLDLGWASTPADADGMMTAINQAQLPDLFEVYAERVVSKNPRAENPAGCYKVAASLDSRLFESFSIDVGYRDPLTPPPDHIATPGLLAFAGIDTPIVPVISIEQHLAEKISAYLRTYPGGRRSTRPKDLVDVLIISKGHVPIDAHKAILAIRHTVPEAPDRLPQPPESWTTTYPPLARQAGVTENLAEAHLHAASFVDPLLSNEASGTWQADTARWES